jgi:hypothetical protein
MGSFGGTIPVVGMYNGYPGTISRAGVNKIKARQVLSTTPTQLAFGESAVLVPDSLGGTWQSVKDFIAGSGTFTAAKLAGFALREVKTNLSYIASTAGSIGGSNVAFYAPGEMAEVIEETSGLTVQVNNGAPVAGNQIYIRIALNGGIPAGVVGGVEAVADGSNTVAVPNVVFTTGVLDGNGVTEIGFLTRQAV